MISPLAGLPAPPSLLIDPGEVISRFHDIHPDPADPAQRVSFGTSGHRGTSLDGSFTEDHIVAITQAIVDYRRGAGIDGPLFLGKDTHAVSPAAEQVALEVLAANGALVRLEQDDGFTPTPVISFHILRHNREAGVALADGIVVTPSHNPPADGGFKYNPPHGGPAGSAITGWIERRANELLATGNRGVSRLARAHEADCVTMLDLAEDYIAALELAVDVRAAGRAGLRIGVDPLGGASVRYWARIAERYGLDLTVTNEQVDPRFAFMTVDHDGRIRMDCSSPWAMAGLVTMKDQFDIAFACDPDADRHGIVTPDAGLLNPNHYLSAALDFLLERREEWPAAGRPGKTVVTSAMLDRVAERYGERVYEVPVGFKWFAEGLHNRSLVFGGEESAGASFLRRDGSPWSTDKDGMLLCLLAIEMLASTGETPSRRYDDITAALGRPCYARVDTPCSAEEKAALRGLTREDVRLRDVAGDPIISCSTTAPGNGEPIGGLKVTTEAGWFAVRPSGTEDIYKVYAESFRSEAHLAELQEAARGVVGTAVTGDK